ncbi:MAG: taurine ABC transporter permease TauC [Rhodospirillaceae bacterium]|nr:MAG: taurine ABC transporter permease TauC [Rhodospirillaceae bacterium]
MVDVTTQALPQAVARAKRKRRNPRYLTLWVAGTTSLGWIVLWWLATELNLVPPLFLPAPADVFHQFTAVARDGFVDATLAQHTGASLMRIGLALLAALLTAVPVGFGLGLSPILRGVFDPIIEFYRPIPPLAYLPLVVIWFGIGEFSKVLLIYLAMFGPIAIATASGVRAVPHDRLRAAQSMGAARLQILRLVVLPNALPEILTGLRIGLGAGWSTLVAAELLAATRGLGIMIQSASQFLVTDIVVMGILVIAVIAFALELVVRGIERFLTPWKGHI